MANGSAKHADAAADRIRDAARHRQQSFTDLLEVVDDEEITGRIEIHNHEKESERPPSDMKGIVWKLALVAVAAMAATLAAALGHH